MKNIKTHLQKITALLLCIFLLRGAGPAPSVNSADSYRTWTQLNAAWRSIILGKSNNTMAQIGCAVTSLAILIVHSGCRTEENFNPGMLCEYLNANGGLDSSGSITWSKSQGLVPEFKFSSYYNIAGTTRAEKAVEIEQKLNVGYYVISCVKNGGHWVAVDYVSGENVYIFDPATTANRELFTSYDYSGVTKLRLFKKDASVATPTATQTTMTSSTVTTAAQPGNKAGIYCTFGDIRLRSTPSTEFKQIAFISKGTVLKITELSGNWGRTEYNGKDGWVSMSYLNYMCSSNTRPKGTYKTTSNLNFRELPGTSYGIYEVIPSATVLEVTDVCGDWGKVLYNGKTGWISLNYAAYINNTVTVTSLVTTHVTVPPMLAAPTHTSSITEASKIAETSADETPDILKGDIDGNGIIDGVDLIFAQQALNGGFRLSASQLYAADIDGDGSLSISDYIAMCRLGTK